ARKLVKGARHLERYDQERHREREDGVGETLHAADLAASPAEARALSDSAVREPASQRARHRGSPARQASAMKRSWGPRRVKSATVPPPRSYAGGDAQKAPISTARPFSDGACWSSPSFSHCESESTRRREARRRISASSSCLPGESAPTADRCVPGETSSARRTGPRDAVAVTMRRACEATSPGVGSAATRTPGTRTAISRTHAAARSGLRPQT